MARASYKLIGGSHTDEYGRVYTKGEDVISDEDLFTKFVRKFEKGVPVPEEEKSDSDDEDDDDDEDNESHDKRGLDVTANFATAEPNGFQVFRKDGKFFVYKGTKKVSRKNLVEDGDVLAFITATLEG